MLLLRPVASYLLLLHPYSPSYTTGRLSSNIMATTSSASSSAASSSLSTAHSYELPVWARDSFTRPPQHGRLRLAHLPTPLYQITTLLQQKKNEDSTSSSSSFGRTLQDYSISLYIKRDDSTGGIELGGNKIRKLEFLLADALHQQCDSVVTIGGEQSNHCRATAAACAMLNLQPHLILRSPASTTNSNHQPKPKTETDGKHEEEPDQPPDDMGTVGNLLFDRIVGSRIYTVTSGEYGRIGSLALVERLGRHLRLHEHQTPYGIPVGGSNGLGSFGYIEAVDEVMTQWQQMMRGMNDDDDEDNNDNGIDHIVFACGSGGTAAGIAIGMALYHQYHHGHNSSSSSKSQQQPRRPPPHVHAMAVCDDPDYFYAFVARIVDEMGLLVPHNNNNNHHGDGTTTAISSSASSLTATEDYVRASMTVHQCRGRGYAISTADELRFIAEFARDTGVVLDPVYTGKALYGFHQLLLQQPEQQEQFRGQRVLFWHTGGALGLYDKCHGNTTNHNKDDLSYWLAQQSSRTKLNVYGNGGDDGGLDLSEPILTE
jgi:D-cysteine desulfhydrase